MRACSLDPAGAGLCCIQLGLRLTRQSANRASGYICEHETVPFDDRTDSDLYRSGEHGTRRDHRMELAVLAARIDIGRQLFEKL